MLFEEKYKEAIKHYNEAVNGLTLDKEIGIYEIRTSLFHVRTALELIVTSMCNQSGINACDASGEGTLLNLINQLGENGIISEDAVALSGSNAFKVRTQIR